MIHVIKSRAFAVGILLISIAHAYVYAHKIDYQFNCTDFDMGMICHPHDIIEYQEACACELDAAFFEYARANYNLHIHDQLQVTARIPKIIHQIWVGPHTPPEQFKEWQQTWITHHPDWQYKLWTDADVKDFPFMTRKQYEQETNYGAKADILRLEILYQYGGLYADIDGECLHSFDPLHHLCDFYIGMFQVNFLRTTARVNNAFIGAAPGHPLILKMIEQVATITNPPSLKEWEVVERTGPSFISKIIKKHIYDMPGINLILPANYFYPWTGTQRRLKLAVQPETYAIHHYAGSWKAHVEHIPLDPASPEYSERKKERARKKEILLKAYDQFDQLEAFQDAVNVLPAPSAH